jgi:thioredoxin-dependent peroxiredoxin
MKLSNGVSTPDFEGQRIDGTRFRLSEYKGSKILLSFFRNGACALCNLRIRELIVQYHEFQLRRIKIVTVFESSIEDMEPFVGRQHPPFDLIADPDGKIYAMYGVESSEEKVKYVIENHLADQQIKDAANAGFPLTKQVGSNFNRLPADFVIGPDFTITRAHYSNIVIDHLPIEQILRNDLVS